MYNNVFTKGRLSESLIYPKVKTMKWFFIVKKKNSRSSHFLILSTGSKFGDTNPSNFIINISCTF